MIDKPLTQAEKAAILVEDRRNSTMLGRSQLDLLELGGRYARQSQVVGGTGAPEYPAASGWTQDPGGVEPPLGLDISAVEPVGEIHEVNASIERRALTSLPSTTKCGDDSASTSATSSDVAVRTMAGANAPSPADVEQPRPSHPKPVFRRPVQL